MKTAVIGSGGWGTALSMVLEKNGHEVTLWSHNPAQTETLRSTRENPRLAGVKLPEGIEFTSDPACAGGKDLIVASAPSFALRNTMRLAAPYITPGTVVVSAKKIPSVGSPFFTTLLKKPIFRSCDEEENGEPHKYPNRACPI